MRALPLVSVSALTLTLTTTLFATLATIAGRPHV